MEGGESTNLRMANLLLILKVALNHLCHHHKSFQLFRNEALMTANDLMTRQEAAYLRGWPRRAPRGRARRLPTTSPRSPAPGAMRSGQGAPGKAPRRGRAGPGPHSRPHKPRRSRRQPTGRGAAACPPKAPFNGGKGARGAQPPKMAPLPRPT